jgi:hypothetical protein
MVDQDDEEPDPPEAKEQPRRPRDRKIDEAKAVLMSRFLSDGTQVFYKRQLEIWLEKEFYHWSLLHKSEDAGFSAALRRHQAGWM